MHASSLTDTRITLNSLNTNQNSAGKPDKPTATITAYRGHLCATLGTHHNELKQ